MRATMRVLGTLCALGLLLAACGDDGGGDVQGTEDDLTEGGLTEDAFGVLEPDDECLAEVADVRKEVDVCISGSRAEFVPADISVGVGDTVRWVNLHPSTQHTVTADDGSFDTGDTTPGESNWQGYDGRTKQQFLVTFDEPGEFGYVCRIHDGMSGTVTVS